MSVEHDDRERSLEQALLSLRDEVASLRARLDEVGNAVGRFGATLVDRLTTALDRAREDAPDVDELLADVKAQVERTLSDARDGAAEPVQEMRRTLETELGKLKEQVAYGMGALLRQLDAIRPESGSEAPTQEDHRRSDAPPPG